MQILRETTEVVTESASSAIATEMQTRHLRPQWINAQQAEGYSGTLPMLNTAPFCGAARSSHPAPCRMTAGSRCTT